jgi:dihydropyrimidinase
VVWDPEKRLTYGTEWSQQRTDYNLYEGWELVGFPEKVFLRGNLLVDQGHWYGQAGMGEYLFRKPAAVVI